MTSSLSAATSKTKNRNIDTSSFIIFFLRCRQSRNASSLLQTNVLFLFKQQSSYNHIVLMLADARLTETSVTRCWNKNWPNIIILAPKVTEVAICFKVQNRPKIFQIFGPLQWENLMPITFKNRPIWSHWLKPFCSLSTYTTIYILKWPTPAFFLVLFSFYLKTIFTEKNSRLQRDSNLYRPNCDHADYLTITTALQSI